MKKSFKKYEVAGLPGGPNELKRFTNGFIISERGQWDYPGQPTAVPTPTGKITMQGVKNNLVGIDNLGNMQYMTPGNDYQFEGDIVYEIPQAKRGGSKKPSKKYSRSLMAKNRLFTKNHLFEKRKHPKNKIFDPYSPYFQDGGEAGCPEGYAFNPITGECIEWTPTIWSSQDQPTSFDPVADIIYMNPNDRTEEMSDEEYNQLYQNQLEHEQLHRLQWLNDHLKGESKTPLRMPSPADNQDYSGDHYYNRRQEEENYLHNYWKNQHPHEAEFIPDEVIYDKETNPAMYQLPWTEEGEARDYENATHSGMESFFPKIKRSGLSKFVDGGPQCPEGYTYDEATKRCVKKNTTCPEGYFYDAQEGRCKSKTYRLKPEFYIKGNKTVPTEEQKKYPFWPNDLTLKHLRRELEEANPTPYIRNLSDFLIDPIKELKITHPDDENFEEWVSVYPDLNYKVVADPNKPKGFNADKSIYYVPDENNFEFEKFKQYKKLKEIEKENLANLAKYPHLKIEIDNSSEISKKNNAEIIKNSDPEYHNYIGDIAYGLNFDMYKNAKKNTTTRECKDCHYKHGVSKSYTDDYIIDRINFGNIYKDWEKIPDSELKWEEEYDYIDLPDEYMIPRFDLESAESPIYSPTSYSRNIPKIYIEPAKKKAVKHRGKLFHGKGQKYKHTTYRYPKHLELGRKEVTRPIPKMVQKITGYDKNFIEGYENENGEYIPGEIERAEQEGRKINFKGASSLRDLKNQKEYERQWLEYQKQKDEVRKRNEAYLQEYGITPEEYISVYGNFKDGGEQDATGFIEMELSNDDINKYVKGGYIVEDISVPSLSRMDDGGSNKSCPPKHVWDNYQKKCIRVYTLKDDQKFIDGVANWAMHSSNPDKITSKYNDQIKHYLYSGAYGYDPKSMSLYKLQTNQRKKPDEETEKILAKQENERAYKQSIIDAGFNPETFGKAKGTNIITGEPIYGDKSKKDIDAINKEAINAFVKEGHKKAILNSPFNTIASFTPAGIPVGVVQGGINLLPDVYNFAKNPTWSNAGSVGMDALMLLPKAKTINSGVKKVINYGADVIGTSRNAGKLQLPKYKNVYRAEHAGFDLPAIDNSLTGRWFADRPEEVAFYVRKLKDPNTGKVIIDSDAPVRILKKRLPEYKVNQNFGASMPEEARIMSMGRGNLTNSELDQVLGPGAGRRFTTGSFTSGDINSMATAPFLYNPTEGILDPTLVNKLRKNSKLFEGKQEAMDYLFKEYQKIKNARPFQSYLPFDKQGGVVSELSQNGGSVSGTQGLMPDFSRRLTQMILDARAQGINLSIGSGYRSYEKQKKLWEQALKKYGSAAKARKWVAPPGGSFHNKGLAVDLSANGRFLGKSANLKATKWAHDNAKKYGLYFRMGNEPWHIEPIDKSKSSSEQENEHDHINSDVYVNNQLPISQEEYDQMIANKNLEFQLKQEELEERERMLHDDDYSNWEPAKEKQVFDPRQEILQNYSKIIAPSNQNLFELYNANLQSQMKNGGFIMELTDKEIERYKKRGYIIEELD